MMCGLKFIIGYLPVDLFSCSFATMLNHEVIVMLHAQAVSHRQQLFHTWMDCIAVWGVCATSECNVLSKVEWSAAVFGLGDKLLK